MNTIGVIIARFQSPYLHEGHKALLQSVKQQHHKMVVVLGVSPVLGSRKNPLDFYTREKMIKRDYPDTVILPLADHPLDVKWSQNLDRLLSTSFPGSRFKLFGSRDSFKTYYSGSNEVVELPESGTYSATIIREQISDKVLDSPEFRTGIIYAYSNVYTKVYATVDIAIFRNNRTEILLGKKEIDQKWRLLGGFADPTDDSYETAAQRELREEAGDIQTTAMAYEKSFQVNDWRYRDEQDKIITCLFSADFTGGHPKGSDDIADVDWFSLEAISKMKEAGGLAPEHFPQIQFLLNKFKK